MDMFQQLPPNPETPAVRAAQLSPRSPRRPTFPGLINSPPAYYCSTARVIHASAASSDDNETDEEGVLLFAPRPRRATSLGHDDANSSRDGAATKSAPGDEERDLEAGSPAGSKAGLYSFYALVVLGFFWVSGGCYGNEELFAAAPPLVVFPCLLITPLVYSLPLALITVELAAAMPYDGGLVRAGDG